MNIEKEIIELQARNARVEADKAWELSWTRGLFIAFATYIIAGVWLVAIGDTLPWAKALVPAVGYLLSTLSLPLIKRRWVRRFTRHQRR
jgi:hypothetical protein